MCSCTPFSSQVRDRYEFSLFGGQKRHPAALYTDCAGAVPVSEYGQNYCRLSHRRDTAVAANTSGMQAGYDTIYERIKGPITEEIVRFLTSEYQRLDALTADGTYSREPQEGTYSGYIFGDYYLLHSYFYPHMEYSVKYSSDMEEILAQAKENMTFYRESGNTAGAAENAYILHHYAGRTIPAFYLYDGWEALLSYDFSDLLILLLLILAVAPAFTREKENGMTLILSSCKRGRWPLLISKCGAGVIFAWILTILFALLNFLVFGLLCGFDGWSSRSMPSKAINIRHSPARFCCSMD